MAVILFLRYRRRTILPFIPFFSKMRRTVTAVILFLGYTHHAVIKLSVIPFFFERYRTVTDFILFLGCTHHAVIKLCYPLFLWEVPYRDVFYPVSGLHAPRRAVISVIPFFFERYHTVTSCYPCYFFVIRGGVVWKRSWDKLLSASESNPWTWALCQWKQRRQHRPRWRTSLRKKSKTTAWLRLAYINGYVSG